MVIAVNFSQQIAWASDIQNYPLMTLKTNQYLAQTEDRSEKQCPTITKPNLTVEGTVLNLECVEFCFLKLKLDDGQKINFNASSDLELDNLVPGMRVKIASEWEQVYDIEIQNCYSGNTILNIERINNKSSSTGREALTALKSLSLDPQGQFPDQVCFQIRSSPQRKRVQVKLYLCRL
jgi:hypothetical protein